MRQCRVCGVEMESAVAAGNICGRCLRKYWKQKRAECEERRRLKRMIAIKQPQRPPTEAGEFSAPTTSQPPVPALPEAKAALDDRFIRQGRGVYKWDKRRREYIWLHNCGRECEAQREVDENNKTWRQLFRIHE